MSSQVSNSHYLYNRLQVVVMIAIIAVLFVAAGSALDVVHLFYKSPPAPTANQNTKGMGRQTTNQKQGSYATSTGDATTSQQSGSIVTPPLLVPTGNFVSNHHPNLSGSPAPNTMTSVCNTSAGASCTITFIDATTNVVRSLPTQVTDKGGSAYWDWKLQDVGLTTGRWKIEAIVRLGNQTQSAQDEMSLEVGP